MKEPVLILSGKGQIYSGPCLITPVHACEPYLYFNALYHDEEITW